MQLHLLPVVRDLAQFPFFSTGKGGGSAQLIVTLLDFIKLITDGMFPAGVRLFKNLCFVDSLDMTKSQKLSFHKQ